MSAELVYRVGDRWITHPLVGDEVTLGRDSQNDVVLEDRSVSRRHARLVRRGDSWRVVDLGSRYGTRVNNVPPGERELRDGDTIQLHRFPLTYVDRAAPGATLIRPPTDRADERAVYQDAVDFHVLASRSPQAARLERLLRVVTRASETILSGPTIDQTFQHMLELIFDTLPVERGVIMVRGGSGGDLVTRAVKRRTEQGSEPPRIEFSRTIADRVIQDKVGVLTTDARADERFAAGASIMAQGIRSALAAPVWHGDRVEGLVYVDTISHVAAFDGFDLDLLSALGNHLAIALEQSRLQEAVMQQQRMREKLERYHSPAVVERIAAEGGSDVLAVEEREATVLFADIVGFTDRCELLEPRAVAELLNHFFGEMTEVVFRHDGTVDKFIGDCLMAVFGVPIATADHARQGARAALEMRDALTGLNASLAPEERVRFRVALHSGRVVAGDVGSARRSDFSVLGANVNLAARLQAEVAQPGQIVVSEDTLALLGDGFELRPVGTHRPRGISRSVACFELIGHLP